MVAEVVRQARALAEAELNGLRTEQSGLERELVRHHAELRNLASKGSNEGGGIARVVELQEAVSSITMTFPPMGLKSLATDRNEEAA